MKRKILLFTLAIPVILCQNAIAQTASRLVAEANWRNDGVSFQYSDSTTYNYSHGRGGDLTHTMMYDNSTVMTYDTGTYTNTWNYIKRYDANNNDTSTIAQYWDNVAGVWVPYSNTLYFYNTSNKLTSMVTQAWSGTVWYPLSRNLYTYNGTGKLVNDLFQVYTLGSYFNTSQKTYYYDAITNNLINETDQDYISSTWIYSNLWDYTYTSANQIQTTTYKTWNGSGWDPHTKYINTYDVAGDMTYKNLLSYNAIDSTWKDDSMHIYSGFVAHNPSMDVVQRNDTGTWLNVMQYTFSYNSYNQLTTSTGISWNEPSAIFEFAAGDPRHNYYYGTYNPGEVSVKNVSDNGGSANVYPVPAQNIINVDLKWDAVQSADLVIYDAQGKVVRHWATPAATQYTSSVSVDNMADGLYFLSITGAQGKIVKQIVIAH